MYMSVLFTQRVCTAPEWPKKKKKSVFARLNEYKYWRRSTTSRKWENNKFILTGICLLKFHCWARQYMFSKLYSQAYGENRERQIHWQWKTELITLVKWIPNWHGWGESRYKDTQLGSVEKPSPRLVQCEPAGREREEVKNSPVKWEPLGTEKNRYLHEIPSAVYLCETCSL